MFLELARPKSWIWSGGVPVSFKIFKNSIGFFIQDSISALQTHKIFKNIKVVTDRQTPDRSTLFWTTLAQLRLQFLEFSGSGPKLQL